MNDGRLPKLPPHAPGMRIGLLGGSFDPPHEGHRLVSLIALRRLGLDRVWWLASPGNPLKDTSHLAPLDTRVELARRLSHHPKIAVTDIESAIHTRYTYDTVRYLCTRCRGVHFVWLMGADNLIGFHRWRRWRDIALLVPIAAVDRPGATLRAMHSIAATALAPYRIDENNARVLSRTPPPALVFLHGPRSTLSSTALRRSRPA